MIAGTANEPTNWMWTLSAVLLGAGVVVPGTRAYASNPPVVSRTAYPTGNASTSVILLERSYPAEVRAGETFEYSIKLTNLTNVEVENLVLAEELPSDFTVSGIEPEPSSRSGTTAVWTVGSLAPRGSTVIRIKGSASRVGELPSCATVTFNTKACSSLMIVQPELVLEKSAPPEVIVCDTIPMTLTVTNRGTGLARNVTVVDRLPDGWTTLDGRNEVSFNAGDLAAGQFREFRLEAKSSRTGQFDNQAAAREDGGLTAEASSSTRVVQPVLALSKSGPGKRFLGRPATFQLTARNDGDAPAVEAVLVDVLPAGMSVVEASDGGRFDGGRVSWNLGTIAVGDSKTVNVTVTPRQKGTFENTATVGAYCSDATASAPLVVEGIPAVLLEVIDIDDPIELDTNETYEIKVINQGSADGTNIVIECVVPAEQVFVSAQGPTQGRTEGDRVVFAPLPILAPKAEAVYRVIVKGTQEGDVRFKVNLTSDQLERPVEETESTHIYR